MARESNITQLQNAQDHEVEKAILEAVRSLRFGSVEIVVHNAKVVQVERKEKLRFAGPPAGS